MIKHLVFFKLAETAERKSKAENAAIIKKELEGLKHIIPEIVSIEVQLNHAEAPSDNYDIVLDTVFSNLHDLSVYANHPEHLKVTKFIAKVRTDRAAIDYEI